MSSERLLIVDDEEANRDMLARRLERGGFSVSAVDSGRVALDFIARRPVDLVLLDTMMPGMNGIDVLMQLRRTFNQQQLPIIMVTAVTESNRVAKAIEAGANDYITKPIDYPVALARIRSQLLRKQAESALRSSEERYALAARGANDGLWDWDIPSGEIYLSERWKTMLGYEVEEIGARADEWMSRVHTEDLDRLRKAIEGHWKQPERPFECEYRMRHRDGSYRWMLGRGMGRFSMSGQPDRMAGSQTDITDRKTLDSLTALPNRVHFEERVGTSLSRMVNEPGYRFCVMFLDLDRFKLINDSLGHVAGDQLLLQVAERLTKACWSPRFAALGQHVVARVGGDEFAILLEGINGPAMVTEVADAILAEMRGPFLLENRSVFCSVTIGMTLSDPRYRTTEEMVRDADTAMYAAKAQGKNRAAVFDSNMRDRVTRRLQIENDLRLAIDRSELRVHYQPRVELATGRICGLEALVRWIHPEAGSIPPDSFIPIAEETGLILDIGLWVLREACRQVCVWHREFPRLSPLAVAVNVSAVQIRERGFVQQVRDVLKETGADASGVHLEVTESVLLENLKDAQRTLTELKQLGIQLKLDDFGTGYSSLKYLSALPFDMLKIDRSFTMALNQNSNTDELVRTIFTMAENLGLQVIAEGVETHKHLEILRGMGCEFGQGHLFSPPATADVIEGLLTQESRKDHLFAEVVK